MSAEVFQSYAQNGEDIVLWRALGHIPNGRYIDVGANEPEWLSVTKAFYDHGWRGITVEPSSHYAQLHREQRPGDLLIEAAIASQGDGTLVLHEIDDSGLSTLDDEVRDRHLSEGWNVREVEVATKSLNSVLDEANWAASDIHFMVVDVEGVEGDVLASIDLTRWRPWVLVIESTAPMSTQETHDIWEPDVLKAGYEFCLFDGLSRYYVASEHAAKLGHQLSYSPCVFDLYQTHLQRDLIRKADAATADTAEWRATALSKWSEVLNEQATENEWLNTEVKQLAAELAATRRTVSWRVTAPLRAVRRRAMSGPPSE